MLGDTYTKVATAQAVTATAVSASSLDQQAARDIGAGRDIGVIFNIDATPVAVRTGATAAVAVATDICTLTAHGLPTGTPIILLTATTISTGFTLGTVYYVIALTANTFSLATTRAIAQTGVADVNFGAADGSFTFSAIPEVEFQVIASDSEALDDTNGKPVVLGSSGPMQARIAHNVTFTADPTNTCNLNLGGGVLPEGMPIIFGGAGTLPVALTAGKVYFVTASTTTAFKIASTLENARAGTFITLAGAGSGVMTVTVMDRQLSQYGPQIQVKFNAADGIPGRYIGARFVVSAPLSAGSFSAQVGPLLPQSPKLYPSGYSVQR